jgi:c-di-GMP-binding flagellar brake protein YcgR
VSDKPFYHEDRRRFKRAEEIFIVTYRLKSAISVTVETRGKEFAAVAMDISAGGVGLDTSVKIDVGTPLRMRFTIVNPLAASEKDRQRVFELDGQCRYCAPSNMRSFRAGITFENISTEDSDFIADFVRVQALRRSEDDRPSL